VGLKSEILCSSTQALQSNSVLKEKFCNTFSDMQNAEENVISLLYHELLQSYMAMANNEFRKNICASLCKKKKFRHRAEIYKSATKRPNTENSQDAPSKNKSKKTPLPSTKGKGRGKGKSNTK
jgi:hypothetical protein